MIIMEITIRKIGKYLIIFLSFLFIFPSLFVIGWYSHRFYIKTKLGKAPDTLLVADTESPASETGVIEID